MARVIHLDAVDSTNKEIKRLGEAEDVSGLAIIADCQSRGRGRGNNSFLSDAGGLYLSMVLSPSVSLDSVSDITAWVAVAVRRALLRFMPRGTSPEIKWINDLVLNKKKLGGILCEIVSRQGRADYIIAGIGINVLQREFDGELKEKATSLHLECGVAPSPYEIGLCVIESLEEMMTCYPENKTEYLREYREHCVTPNNRVTLLCADGTKTEGEALCIDDNFRLVIKTEAGEIKAVDAGDVSVRGLYGYL